MGPGLRLLSVVVLVATAFPAGSAASQSPRPRLVIFVHGMGESAAAMGVASAPDAPAPFGDLLSGIADRWPRDGACQADAQPDRPWGDGSPCVFRYIEDMAEADEGGQAAAGPNDSQSSVRGNGDKLAREVDEVVGGTGDRVVLIGYSMGGAIIRSYLAHHPDAAARSVEAVILIDAASQGSWGFSLVSAFPRRFGAMGQRLMTTLQALAASAASVDLTRPGPRELRPRSEHLRSVAAVPPPEGTSYYTFWGDVRVAVARSLLTHDLPDLELPSLGDLGLLPGDPDPSALPELGGQRFTPRVSEGRDAWDVPHAATVRLTSGTIRALIEACGAEAPGGPSCTEIAAGLFDIPNQHTAVPFAMDRIEVDVPDLGRMTLLEATMAAIGRNQP